MAHVPAPPYHPTGWPPPAPMRPPSPPTRPRAPTIPPTCTHAHAGACPPPIGTSPCPNPTFSHPRACPALHAALLNITKTPVTQTTTSPVTASTGCLPLHSFPRSPLTPEAGLQLHCPLLQQTLPFTGRSSPGTPPTTLVPSNLLPRPTPLPPTPVPPAPQGYKWTALYSNNPDWMSWTDADGDNYIVNHFE